MFRDGTKLPEFSLRIDLRYGGLGDCVQRMPAIRYLYTNTQHVRQYVFVYDYLLPLFELTFKDMRDRVHIMPMSAQEGWLKRDWCKAMPYVNFEPVQLATSKPHLTEVGFLEIVKRIPERGPLWNIPQPDLTNIDVSCYDVPKGAYGVLQVQHTAPVRAWPTNEVEEVARWMVDNQITPLLLGKSSSTLGNGKDIKSKDNLDIDNLPPEVVDLRNKTNLLQALKIIEGAKFIVGVDGGLMNLSYMTQTPVIVGFTSIEPSARIPFRNGVQDIKTIIVKPDNDLECKFCETRQPYVVFNTRKGPVPHDYKKCLYEDYKCVTQMKAYKFIDGIKQVIGFKGPGTRQGKWYDAKKNK